jgi:hypothetical protein
MPTFAAVKKRNAWTWRPRDVTGWLSLAASPALAIMALFAATNAPRIAICSSTMPPIDGMAWMYILMSLFHVSPWLKLASHPKLKGD